MNSLKHYLRFFLIIMITICISCSTSKAPECSNNIVFQLNWVDDPTFTGEYVAKEKYWLLDRLNVTLKQGGLGVDPIAMVISKKVDYAVVGADKALISIADDKPIRIIAVDLQRNPVGWIARSKLKVISFEDLRNRNDLILGDKAGTEISAILKLVLNRKNLNIKPKGVSFDFSYFIANENVIYPVYLNEEPVRAELLHKIKINEIDPSLDINGAIRLYGNVVITHEDKVKKCQTQITNLKKGLRSGWEFAAANNDEALSIVLKYVKNDKDYVREVMKRTIEFATRMYGKEVPPGHMEYTAWEMTIKTLQEANLLSKNIDLNEAIYLK